MEATRFDAITKVLSRMPRRQVLGGLATGALSPLLGLGEREVSAIVQLCGEPGSPACPAGHVCRNGLCVAKCGDPFSCKGGGGGGCPGACFCGKAAKKKG